MVLVDGNALIRRSLLKAVAIAAGRIQEEKKRCCPASARRISPTGARRCTAARSADLVVEDNETNQKVILRQLALLGFAADIADNGRAALERWHSGDYVLLLTDLHMPKMDGYELTAAIRSAEQQDGRHIPIIALTANALKARLNIAAQSVWTIT